MKVKLLKKVRKNFRIIENGLGDQTLQERQFVPNWANWSSNAWEAHYVNQLYEWSTCLELLKCVLNYRYFKYTRKYQVEKLKKGQFETVWYNANS